MDRRQFLIAAKLLLIPALLAPGIFLAGCKSEAPRKTSSDFGPPDPDANQPPDAPITEAATNKHNSTQPDTRPIIVAYGDSLTAGYGAAPGESYPDYLQRDLDQLGYAYRVANLGVSGNTTKDGVDRLKDVLALKPVVVIVAFGGNDGLRGLPIDASRSNLDKIVSTLTNAGIQVVLGGITLPPNYGPDYIRQFNETYQLLSRKYHAPLLPFLLLHVYGTPGSMQQDGIHATAQGNRQVAKNLLPLITPLLTK